MAKGDIEVLDLGSGYVALFQVDDRTTSSAAATIKAGEPVKRASDGSPFLIVLATGDPEQGTDKFVGIAKSESTETSTVNGTVEVYVCAPDTLLQAKATTAANVDAQSEIDALVGDAVSLDLAAGVFTIDENEGNDDNAHGFVIEGGDPVSQKLRFRPKSAVLDGHTILA